MNTDAGSRCVPDRLSSWSPVNRTRATRTTGALCSPRRRYAVAEPAHVLRDLTFRVRSHVAGLVIDLDDAIRDIRGEPCSVRCWDKDVGLAVLDEDRYRDVSNVEAPRPQKCKVVVHPAPHAI